MQPVFCSGKQSSNDTVKIFSKSGQQERQQKQEHIKWSAAIRNASYLQNSYVNRTSKQVLIFLVEGASVGNSM